MGAHIPCQNPACSCTIPLIKQFWFCKKKKKDSKKSKLVAYRPVADREAETVDFELLHGDALREAMDEGFDPKDGTVTGPERRRWRRARYWRIRRRWRGSGNRP